jgi:hypothetical protein
MSLRSTVGTADFVGRHKSIPKAAPAQTPRAHEPPGVTAGTADFVGRYKSIPKAAPTQTPRAHEPSVSLLAPPTSSGGTHGSPKLHSPLGRCMGSWSTAPTADFVGRNGDAYGRCASRVAMRLHVAHGCARRSLCEQPANAVASAPDRPVWREESSLAKVPGEPCLQVRQRAPRGIVERNHDVYMLVHDRDGVWDPSPRGADAEYGLHDASAHGAVEVERRGAKRAGSLPGEVGVAVGVCAAGGAVVLITESLLCAGEPGRVGAEGEQIGHGRLVHADVIGPQWRAVACSGRKVVALGGPSSAPVCRPTKSAVGAVDHDPSSAPVCRPTKSAVGAVDHAPSSAPVCRPTKSAVGAVDHEPSSAQTPRAHEPPVSLLAPPTSSGGTNRFPKLHPRRRPARMSLRCHCGHRRLRRAAQIDSQSCTRADAPRA